MSTKLLGARDQRAVVIGAASMLGLVVALRGLPAWRSWRAEVRAVAVEAQAQAAQSDALLASFAASLDTLEARTARLLQLGPALLAGGTSGEAAATLSGILGELARQSLVRLDAVDIRVDSAGGRSLPRATVGVQATADITGLSAFLQGLEQGPALLAIRQLVVRPQATDGSADQVELLSIRLTVEGLALVRTPGDSL